MNDIKNAHYTLGKAYLSDGQYEEALSQFETSLRLDPEFIDAYHGLALAHLGLHQIQEAQTAALNALRLNPNYEPVLSLLNTIVPPPLKSDDDTKQPENTEAKPTQTQRTTVVEVEPTQTQRTTTTEPIQTQRTAVVETEPTQRTTVTQTEPEPAQAQRTTVVEPETTQNTTPIEPEPTQRMTVAEPEPAQAQRTTVVEPETTQAQNTAATQTEPTQNITVVETEPTQTQNATTTEPEPTQTQETTDTEIDIDKEMERGRVLLGNKQHLQAEAIFKKIIKTEPSSALAHQLLGQTYMEIGDYKNAKSEADIALQIRPSSRIAQELQYAIKYLDNQEKQRKKYKKIMQYLLPVVILAIIGFIAFKYGIFNQLLPEKIPPALSIDTTLEDPQSKNGRIDAGETVRLKLRISNTGGTAKNVEIAITPESIGGLRYKMPKKTLNIRKNGFEEIRIPMTADKQIRTRKTTIKIQALDNMQKPLTTTSFQLDIRSK